MDGDDPFSACSAGTLCFQICRQIEMHQNHFEAEGDC